MNFDEIKTAHFVGIGGIGMSAVAEILASSGITVSGCDLKRSASTDLLESRGISVTLGHDPSHVRGNDLLVYTAAVKGANAEVEAAREQGIRIMRRSEALGAIVNQKRAVGVSGTHGKTTTSAMVATILAEAGLDPTVIVGGMVRNFATNAMRGAGEFLVVEADEYDRTFHHLHPEVAIVTNVEADHLEYFGTFDAVVEAFRIFLEGVRGEGAIVACVDDAGVRRVIGEYAGGARVVAYGLSEGAAIRAIDITYDERGSSFEVPGIGFVRLFVPGEHNVRNALGAIGAAKELGVEPAAIVAGIARFLGVDRRFQVLGEYGGAVIVDDYAHHPTEILATLRAARQGYPGRRVVALFQPHLYSRTRDFAQDFADSLVEADVALIAPVYAAREQPLEGVSARLIADLAKKIEFLDRSNAQIVNELRRRLAPNDIFIAMGAGDVHEIAEALVRSAVDGGVE
jgi:UDP-N-acetylmuramate--alanine ligase